VNTTQNTAALLESRTAVPKDQALLRNSTFTVLVLIWLGLFWHRLYALGELAVRSDLYSHTIFIPFLSVVFIYLKRRRIFSETRFDLAFATPLFLAGVSLYGVSLYHTSLTGASNELFAPILSLVMLLVGSFGLCYGSRAAREAAFPLLFLLLMVPVPAFALEVIVRALQHTSADGSAILFSFLGIPAHRENLTFDLPGIRILVGEECSGIRSTIALFITIILAAQLSLKSNWTKLILCILVVPIAVVKNSVRIVTLSTLALYVNRDFLYGHLHRQGGVIFFMLGLGILAGFLRLLELWERRIQPRGKVI